MKIFETRFHHNSKHFSFLSVLYSLISVGETQLKVLREISNVMGYSMLNIFKDLNMTQFLQVTKITNTTGRIEIFMYILF